MQTLSFESPTSVYFKLSGELMGTESSPLAAEMIQASALRMQCAATALFNMNVAGMTVIPGGGNFVRGRSFPRGIVGPNLARLIDGNARLATIVNAGVLSAALSDLGMPNVVLLAPGMSVEDPTLGKLQEFTPWRLRCAHRQRKIVLFGGGIGRDKCTTDAAVVSYALQQARSRWNQQSVRAYKATDVDGVYDKNPKEHGDAQFIDSITAGEAIAMGIEVVDPVSLSMLAQHRTSRRSRDVSLRVFNGEKHDLLQVVHSELAGVALGSLIRPGRAQAA